MSWDNIKKFFDAKAIAILGLIAVTGYNTVSDWITKGREVEFNEKVDERFIHNMEDPGILLKILQSQQVADFAEKASDRVETTIVEKVLREDSAKISTVSFLGKQTGLRDEDILPLLADILKEWKQVKELITTRYVRGSF